MLCTEIVRLHSSQPPPPRTNDRQSPINTDCEMLTVDPLHVNCQFAPIHADRDCLFTWTMKCWLLMPPPPGLTIGDHLFMQTVKCWLPISPRPRIDDRQSPIHADSKMLIVYPPKDPHKIVLAFWSRFRNVKFFSSMIKNTKRGFTVKSLLNNIFVLAHKVFQRSKLVASRLSF